MPELPEVETVKRTLSEQIVGKEIADVDLLLDKYYQTVDRDKLIGKKIARLSRRGKYLFLHLTQSYVLLFHLRMTGKLIFCQERSCQTEKHTHLIIRFSDASQLKFNDIRKFGLVYLLTEEEAYSLPSISKMGPEPLSEDFTVEYLKKKLNNKKSKIKALLLDQHFIAGIGNIYADEALFNAGINPEAVGSSLTPDQIKRLHHAIVTVLKQGIKYGGTTIRDYVDGTGQKGSFQQHLAVYGQENHPCLNCGREIIRKKICGRSSYFCSYCQRL